MKKQMLCLLFLSLFIASSYAQLRQNFYQNTCPNVESIVQAAVTKKFQQTFVTIPGTLRLFFHDCFVRGCDASVILANANSEKDHPDDQSLAGDGFDTVIKAKAAVDSNPSCRNKVSCADILALATRDVIRL
ncbi:peroxidase 16-like protein, partial [Tanacetum coccineum]